MHRITIEKAIEQIAEAIEAGRTPLVIRGPDYTAFQVDTEEHEYVQFSLDSQQGLKAYATK